MQNTNAETDIGAGNDVSSPKKATSPQASSAAGGNVLDTTPHFPDLPVPQHIKGKEITHVHFRYYDAGLRMTISMEKVKGVRYRDLLEEYCSRFADQYQVQKEDCFKPDQLHMVIATVPEAGKSHRYWEVTNIDEPLALKLTPSPKPLLVRISPSDFKDWMAWLLTMWYAKFPSISNKTNGVLPGPNTFTFDIAYADYSLEKYLCVAPPGIDPVMVENGSVIGKNIEHLFSSWVGELGASLRQLFNIDSGVHPFDVQLVQANVPTHAGGAFLREQDAKYGKLVLDLAVQAKGDGKKVKKVRQSALRTWRRTLVGKYQEYANQQRERGAAEDTASAVAAQSAFGIITPADSTPASPAPESFSQSAQTEGPHSRPVSSVAEASSQSHPRPASPAAEVSSQSSESQLKEQSAAPTTPFTPADMYQNDIIEQAAFIEKNSIPAQQIACTGYNSAAHQSSPVDEAITQDATEDKDLTVTKTEAEGESTTGQVDHEVGPLTPAESEPATPRPFTAVTTVSSLSTTTAPTKSASTSSSPFSIDTPSMPAASAYGSTAPEEKVLVESGSNPVDATYPHAIVPAATKPLPTLSPASGSRSGGSKEVTFLPRIRKMERGPEFSPPTSITTAKPVPEPESISQILASHFPADALNGNLKQNFSSLQSTLIFQKLLDFQYRIDHLSGRRLLELGIINLLRHLGVRRKEVKNKPRDKILAQVLTIIEKYSAEQKIVSLLSPEPADIPLVDITAEDFVRFLFSKENDLLKDGNQEAHFASPTELEECIETLEEELEEMRRKALAVFEFLNSDLVNAFGEGKDLREKSWL
ncbi:hypothetical protein BJ508DRAFT_329145 [Ascobolus immersus RN42]|uniref:Uncharacterized protein n=1 Tax=Ascobolus immersus RN42 TaxID=1160509 RepID=A0A3N4I344_ASCIM|nr:hypothetical protein BJ508DRAFT_329145 [Ascobolus immersus RN42]